MSEADELARERQALMVEGLRRALAARQGQAVSLIETHISFVLVCGDRAYKIKKALRTPFLDHSTLPLRQHACAEELRLNRRLAAGLYLAVVPITGTAGAPELGGTGTPIDAAVEMRAFADDGLWDHLARRGELRAAQVDELVRVLGPFHAAAAVADPSGRLGTPAQVRAPVLANLDELQALIAPDDDGAVQSLHELRRWEAAAASRLAPVMAQRLAQGRVRECHGDLHLGNVTSIDGRTTVFDGIEFNDDFRWIDVMSEVAFMAMDLHAHGLPRLAHRFVDGYLAQGGDYGGAAVLAYYLVHRALVRATVALLRAAQHGPAEAAEAAEAATCRAAARRYIGLAVQFVRRDRAPTVLMLTHGFSGSGKSTLTQGLLEEAGAIRIRADVERKRLAGLQPLERSTAPGLYGRGMTDATYARLGQQAAAVLSGGFHAILDATFLSRARRDDARALATRLGVACVILDFEADPEVLFRRVRERTARAADASDADESVLAAQLGSAEPLQADELPLVFRCQAPGGAGNDPGPVDWTPLLERLAPGGAVPPP